MKEVVIRAFTTNGHGGNIAGVVMGMAREEAMQELATELGFSETVFIDSDKLYLRYFTPVEEVPLCGHATLAAFHLLQEKGIVQAGRHEIETISGKYMVEVRENGEIFLKQAKATYYRLVREDEFSKALGDVPIKDVVMASTGLKDILVQVKTRNRLSMVLPDDQLMSSICESNHAIGFHVWYKGETVHCRNFAPLVGIPEESATGTSNGALISYLHKKKIVKTNQVLTILQGEDMGKTSTILAYVDEDGYPWVGGYCSF